MSELTARHGRGTAWARHAMCESALRCPVECFLTLERLRLKDKDRSRNRGLTYILTYLLHYSMEQCP